MFEHCHLVAPGSKITATDFAERVGVHSSAVSRGRAVYKAKDQILHACKNVYELSHRDLERLISEISGKAEATAQKAVKPQKKLTVQRRVGTNQLSVSGQGGKLSVAASGLALNKKVLEGLSDVIAAYLKEHGVK